MVSLLITEHKTVRLHDRGDCPFLPQAALRLRALSPDPAPVLQDSPQRQLRPKCQLVRLEPGRKRNRLQARRPSRGPRVSPLWLRVCQRRRIHCTYNIYKFKTKLWDIRTQKVLYEVTNNQKTVTHCHVLSGGDRILTSSLDQHLKIYDVAGLTVTYSQKFKSPIMGFDISTNN